MKKAMLAPFHPASVAGSDMGSAALAPSEESTLTAPGRSFRDCVQGGGENWELESISLRLGTGSHRAGS